MLRESAINSLIKNPDLFFEYVFDVDVHESRRCMHYLERIVSLAPAPLIADPRFCSGVTALIERTAPMTHGFRGHEQTGELLNLAAPYLADNYKLALINKTYI